MIFCLTMIFLRQHVQPSMNSLL